MKRILTLASIATGSSFFVIGFRNIILETIGVESSILFIILGILLTVAGAYLIKNFK